ncbi:MAG: exodeoxyribonuclease VII large subunit [Planctomycetota bacterium]|nr:MAG: exodeoxyribonuclease VII large subunit [Planctomycetota bacterium]
MSTISPARQTAPSGEQVLTVSQLTALLKGVVEDAFPSVWVAGEISNFSQPQSGHCYLTLKDDGAQLRAVIWKNTAARLKMRLHDGLEVVCRGRLDLYPPRGSYQLVIDELQPKGMGALELALRQLREKLQREGLFDARRKRPLPAFPRRIGVVTSPTGAAIRDFLQVLRRRWRGVEVLVFPARVQGECAADEIAAAIGLANRVAPRIDVLVVTRGGGSLEDLWCFNEETVVRAIAGSAIPTVSAVGHEIDVTLSDLAADVRALTPSEAAERIVPSTQDVAELVRGLRVRLTRAITHRVAQLRSRVEAVGSRPALARPLEGIHLRGRRLDELSLRMNAAVKASLRDRQAAVAGAAGKLESLSPLAVLARGYSLTYAADGERLIVDADSLRPGDLLSTQFHRGSATSVVQSIAQGRETPGSV